MTLKLITAPATEPLTVSEAKLHLRVDHSTDDAVITAMITAAREQAEHALQRALMPQTWETVLDGFPADSIIVLGLVPVASVTSVKYLDTAGAEQTVSAANYSLDAETVPGRILPDAGYTWPSTQDDTLNTVRARFVAGYANAAAVPAGIKAWMLLQIGALYRNREAFAAGITVAELPGGFVDRLLDPYRTFS
jgi:uncharacterized phiE125 gp8 family phage protein